MNDPQHWCNRRTLLRTGIAGSLGLVAGCTGGSEGAATETEMESDGSPTTVTDPSTTATDLTTTATETPDSPGFYDDFQDGDYTTDPAWRAEFETGVGEVGVVDRSPPAGGSKALRISDATDEELNEQGQSARAVLADGDEGWQGAWTLTGQFYAEAVPSGEYEDDVHVALGFYETGAELLLNPRVELLFFGDRVGAETGTSVLDEGTWYDYEFTHDGAGSYTAARWPAAGDRTDGLSLTLDHEPMAASEQFALVTYGGYPEFVDQPVLSPRPDPGSHRLTADHAYVQWEPER